MKFALIYESENGIITMTPRSDYQVMSITGLEQVAAEAYTKRYSRIPGQKTLYKTPEPRTIVIEGRINAPRAQRRFITDELQKVFDNTIEGTLKINMYGKLRRINCFPDTVAFGELNNGKLPFVISLTADNPYFKDWEDIELSLFTRVNNLIDGMTFPRVFSYCYTRGNAVNNGIADIEPIIIIETGAPTPEAPETGILIENETTGIDIFLDYISADGETITIDIPQRKIISSISGDITRYKPLEYSLSEFVFVKGANMIKFTNKDGGQPLTAKAVYSNLYTEAMF